jgi:hypothetical protein
VVSAGLLYPETAAAIFMAVLILAAVHEDRDALGLSLAVGVLLGAVALLRPVALVLVPVVAAWTALAAKVPVRRGLAHLGLVIAGTLLVLAPWTYRNYRLQGQLAPIARAGTHMAPVARADVAREGLTLAILRKAWTDPAGLAARTGRQFVQFWELVPTRLTTDDPERRVALHQTDPRLPTGALVAARHRNLVSMITSAVEFGLALIGLILLWRTQRRAALLITTVTIAFALGYALFVAKLRYRIPVLPLVFVLAGIGAWRLGTALAGARRRERPHRGEQMKQASGPHCRRTLARYQAKVLRIPPSRLSMGKNPSCRSILLVSIAYRRSWPGRSFTNVIRVVVRFRELYSEPPAECRRGMPKVHRHVVNLSVHDSGQLPLWPLDLVVQPAQNASGGPALIVLHEREIDSRFAVPDLVPGFDQIPSIVGSDQRFNEQHAGEPGETDLHLSRASDRSSSR